MTHEHFHLKYIQCKHPYIKIKQYYFSDISRPTLCQPPWIYRPYLCDRGPSCIWIWGQWRQRLQPGGRAAESTTAFCLREKPVININLVWLVSEMSTSKQAADQWRSSWSTSKLKQLQRTFCFVLILAPPCGQSAYGNAEVAIVQSTLMKISIEIRDVNTLVPFHCWI